MPDKSTERDFVLKLGRALHRYGYPAHRLDEDLIGERLGLEARELGAFVGAGVEAASRMTLVAASLVTGLLLSNVLVEPRALGERSA